MTPTPSPAAAPAPSGELPPLPAPWDYCYVWNGPYGARKFTAAHHNGRACDDQVLVFTAEQMRDYARAALAAAPQPARNERSVPRIIDVLAKWEDENGALCAAMPEEWAALHEAVTDAAVIESPRMVRAALAGEAATQPAAPSGQRLSDEQIEADAAYVKSVLQEMHDKLTDADMHTSADTVNLAISALRNLASMAAPRSQDSFHAN